MIDLQNIKINLKKTMNSLRKMLTKDDVKKYQKKKNQYDQYHTRINQTNKSHKYNQTDINQLIECRTVYQQSLETVVMQKVKSIIKKSFQHGQLTVSIEIIVKSIQSILDNYYPQQQFDRSRTNFNQNDQKILNLIEFLQKLHKHQQKNQIIKSQHLNSFNKQLSIVVGRIKQYLDEKMEKRKKKDLDEYDKIIGMLKPTMKKKQQKRQNIQKLNKKLLNSLSSGNLHIKVITQQIQIQKIDQKDLKKSQEQKKLQRKKSQGNVIQALIKDKKVVSPRNQGEIKLQNFFKDQNVKITKTKVQYDYNAILQASKSNIQARNKTFQPQNGSKITVNNTTTAKNNNFQVTNINKAKKDKGFVFYRPKANKNG